MNVAIGLHDRIVRSNISKYGGYEVGTNKNAFQVAFSDVLDAMNFCLQTQEALHKAPWEQDILVLTDGDSDAGSSFRGLRVKMALHCGEVETADEAVSGRTIYTGENFYIAKNLGAMGHGGQILVTSDVWNLASHLAQSTLGSPQVLDLGSHTMPTQSSQMYDGLTTKHILQLVPASLASDYSQSGRSGGPLSNYYGRTFQPIKTTKAVSPSFHEAPCTSNSIVSMVFVDTAEVEPLLEDSSLLLVALSKHIGVLLQEQQASSGYQCNEFMFAFEGSAAAARFGLIVQESLEQVDILDVSLKGRLKIGVHEGVFEAMIPNPMTGRADYFGRVINRVVHIAEVVAPGCVCIGKEAQDMDEFDLQPISYGFMLDFTGRHRFEEVGEEFSLYRCHPCNSWYSTMLDNRVRSNSLQVQWRD